MVEQKNKKKVFLMILGVVILIGMVSGLTYAFFNYTRTGGANTIATGRIYFNTSQGTAMNLTNAFPIDVSNGLPNNNSNVGSVTINVLGDTDYTGGIEYLVSAVGVNNTVGSGNNERAVPISIDVSVSNNTENDPATNLGTANAEYFTNRGGNTSMYKILANDTISEDDELLVGYIAPGATGVDGNITIRAYFDKAKVAISDTYPEGNVTINNQTYTNGTTSDWANNRVVVTTDEWNALQSNGFSFQVKVESKEGIWVEEPASRTIESCPGCKFIYTEMIYRYDNGGYSDSLEALEEGNETLYDDYNDVISSTGKNYFLGITINDTTHKIEKAYACGIKGENPNMGIPFCIEGLDSSFTDDSDMLNNSETGIWQGNCELNGNWAVYCEGDISAALNGDGAAFVGTDVNNNIDGGWCAAVYDEGQAFLCR